MNFFNIFNRKSTNDNKDGWFSWSLWGGAARFDDFSGDLDRLKMVLSSPAALKVISIICDIYTLNQKYVYKGDEEVVGAEELTLFDNPNPMQSQAQWDWTYMFWNLLGNANLYLDKEVADSTNKMYWLIPHKMEWPQYFRTNEDKLIFTSSSLSTLQGQQIVYRYNDGTSIPIPFKKIIQLFDLTNGVGNWFKGNSRLDALCKIINISEAALDAKKINVEFSGKFLVAGTTSEEDVRTRGLGPEEKKNIEGKVLGDKTVHAIRSMVDIHRFVSDMGSLELDPAYVACALQIADMYGLPKEISALLTTGSTFENQEKARAAVVTYCLEPKAKDLMGALSSRTIVNKKKRFVASWDHLQFMQYAEKERADVRLKTSQTLLNLQKAGVSEDDINKFLDTNFKELKPISSDVRQPEQQEPEAGASNKPADEGNQQGVEGGGIAV